MQHPEFKTNHEARKAFAKMRSAIAGLYAYRGRLKEADKAFRQAIRLCPDSPEPNYRLAQMLKENGNPGDAIDVMRAYIKEAPDGGGERARTYLETLKDKQRSTRP